MRIFLHVTLMLLVAAGIGFSIRQLRAPPALSGPGPEDVVYSNDEPFDAATVTNDEPSHPPDDQSWLSRFELTERDGSTVTSDQLLGAPYVVSFFFSTCPGSCVQQNQKIRELQDEFAGTDVRFVAISCDPETDTPEVLREYAARFGADDQQWLFLTGDLTYIRRVGGEIFQQPVNKKFHTDRFVLVDAEGAIEGFYNWPEPRQFEKLKARIAELLAGSGRKDS